MRGTVERTRRAWRVITLSVRAIERDYDLWLDKNSALFARPTSERDYVDPAYLGIDLESLEDFRRALAAVNAAAKSKETRALTNDLNKLIRSADDLSIRVSYSQWRVLDQALRQLCLYDSVSRSADDFLLLPRAIVRSHANAAHAARRDPATLFALTSREFEEAIAGLLHLKGFEVAITPAARDRGFDLIALHRVMGIPFKWVVECKQYSRMLVSAPVVQKLFGAAVGEGADRALVVTTSGFTRDALNFARHNTKLLLWNGTDLRQQLAGCD
jgi:HJR/Mrr/RecB family endonuclease